MSCPYYSYPLTPNLESHMNQIQIPINITISKQATTNLICVPYFFLGIILLEWRIGTQFWKRATYRSTFQVSGTPGRHQWVQSKPLCPPAP